MKLTANHLAKTVKGKTILSDINLTLESGVVYGFVGRNGSGKTMLFRALSGLMKPDAGEVRYGERVLHRDFSVLPGLGMVLENVGLYPELTGYKNLELLSRINKKIGEEEIRDAIRRVGLDPADKRPYRKYSLGMKQRIVIAQAIMEKPEVLMLDEPTNSLDEGGVEEIRTIVKQEKERGAIVLLSSHNREDISLLADEVYQMEGGCLMARTVMEA
ncbi:MAG: ABC transporter ATP-binding protein [Oscillospiraceae bacterium]